jgi:hypothetical protein
MSAAGLLGRALLGGVQGAAATAYEVGKEKRKKESELELIDLKDQKARALEQMRLDNNMKVSEFEATQRAEQARLDRASAERIESMRAASGSQIGRVRTSKYTDPNTGQEFERRYDSVTGEWLDPLPGGAAANITPEIDEKARQIAKEKVDSLAGWLSTDAADFKEFGGSRAAAEEQFYQEALQNLGGSNQTGGANPLIQAVQSGQLKVNDPAASTAPEPRRTAPTPPPAATGNSTSPPKEAGLLNRFFDFGRGAAAGAAYEQVVKAVGEGSPIDPQLIELAMPHLKGNPYYLERARALVQQ